MSACNACGAQIIFVRVGKTTVPCSVPANPRAPLAAVRRAFGWTGWWVTAEKPAGSARRYFPHRTTCKPEPRRPVADHRRQQVSASALPLPA